MGALSLLGMDRASLTFLLFFQERSVHLIPNQCVFSFSSVTQSCLTLCDPMDARPPCPSPSPRLYANSCPLSRWCHPTISFPVVPFSSCFQCFPASGSLQMSQLFTSGWPKYWGFSFNISPSNDYLGLISFRIDWFVFLLSRELSRVFSSNTVQKHQFFSAQLSLKFT